MNSYLSVVKMLLKNMFKRDKTKKSSNWIIVAYVIIGLAYALIMLGMVGMVAAITLEMKQLSLLPEFSAMIVLIGCLAVLVLGTISMLSYLYFSRDTEFFMALPIKPSTIYLAKLTIVLITELAISLLITLPCIITIGIVSGAGVLYYLIMLLAVIFSPTMSLFLSSIIAIPIMYVVGFLRNKGVISSIAMILLFALIMAVYLTLVMSASSGGLDSGNVEQIVASMTNTIKTIATVCYPVYAICNVAFLVPFMGLNVGLSVLINLVIFFGSIAIFGFVAVLISQAVYKRGAMAQLESVKKKVSAKINYSATTAKKAIMLKEWKELIRNPSFAFQCLSGVLICPIMLFVMGFMFKTQIDLVGATNPEALPLTKAMLNVTLSAMIIIMGIGMNIGASTCITREGQMYYYMKIIPVDYYTQIQAKRMVFMIISSITVIIGCSAKLAFFFDPIDFVMSTITLLVYNYAYLNFAMYFDMARPKLNWVTAQEAVKNNRNTVVPMLINMGVGGVMLIILILFTVLIPLTWLATLVAWGVVLVVSIFLAILSHVLIKRNSQKLIEKIGI